MIKTTLAAALLMCSAITTAVHAQPVGPVTTVTVVEAPPPVATTATPIIVDDSVYEAGFYLGVPIWFTPDKGIVQPGVSFETRFARRFGLLAPEITLGWQINWLDEDDLPNALRNYNFTIDSFYMSLGARVYVVDRGIVQPFVSGAFDVAFWHLTGDTSTVCGYYYCAETANYDLGIGFSGRLGLAIIPNSRVQLEAGARIAMTFPVGPIKDVEAWVTPYLGFTSRF